MSKKLRILIDIGHPAHVHYFKNFIKIMQSKGHDFLIIARNKEITFSLLNTYQIPFISRGKGKNSLLGKIFYTFFADIYILIKCIKWKPNIIMSFGTPYAAHSSKLYGIPHIAISDTEHAKLGILAFIPFTETILTPDVYYNDLGEKQVKFKSYIEFTYLHKNYFNPITNIKKELNISESQKFVIFRFVSWNASHDIGQKGIPYFLKLKLIKLFVDKGYRVLISSEGKLNTELIKYQIKIAPEKIHSVIKASDFFIGESGTMATEAAILGTPSVYINSLNAGVFDDEVKYKLLYSFRNTEGLYEKIIELLQNPNLKLEHLNNLNTLVKEKIDITAFLVWFIENYPDSKKAYIENPLIQNKFLN